MTFVNQLNVFFVCFSYGVISALARDVFSGSLAPLRGDKQEGRAWLCYELVFFCVMGSVFVALSALLGLPELRGYMPIGIALGFLLYYKTLRIIVAFLKKVCYNIVNKKIRKRKNSDNER